MAPYVLVWALPGEWDQWDLDDPIAEDQLIGELKRRGSSYNFDEAAERTLLDPLVNALRHAQAAGTLLWAIRSDGDGTEQHPLSTVSLSIALVDLIPDPAPDPSETNGKAVTSGPNDLRRRARAIPLDRSMTGFVVEQRSPVSGLGADLSMYSAELFVVPPLLPVTAVIGVSTLDPAREDEAREAAGFVARSIHFIHMEEP